LQRFGHFAVWAFLYNQQSAIILHIAQQHKPCGG
jgi:hypothetical protein